MHFLGLRDSTNGVGQYPSFKELKLCKKTNINKYKQHDMVLKKKNPGCTERRKELNSLEKWWKIPEEVEFDWVLKDGLVLSKREEKREDIEEEADHVGGGKEFCVFRVALQGAQIWLEVSGGNDMWAM